MIVTQSAQFFLEAMAKLTWAEDDRAYGNDEIRTLEAKAEELRKQRHASHLGVKHLEGAFRIIYRADLDGTEIRKVRAKAKVLEREWRKRHEGEFIPYERGGGYTVKVK